MDKPRLSYSRIHTFHSCRRAYYWKYIQNLVPVEKPDYFQVGIVVHALRELWIKTGTVISTLDEMKEYVQGLNPANDPAQTDVVAYQCSKLFNHYLDSVKSTPYEFISPEMHLDLDCGDFSLYARIDALAVDRERYVFRDELKTTSKMDSNYLNGLSRGLQTGIAHWILDELMPEHKIRGTLFEILVKTKAPQYAAHPSMKDRFTIDYTKECVYSTFADMQRCGDSKELLYPSMGCSFGSFRCAYEPLCRNDTPNRRAELFTKRLELQDIGGT